MISSVEKHNSFGLDNKILQYSGQVDKVEIG